MTCLTINCTLDCDRKMKRPPGPLILDRVLLFENDPDPEIEEPWSVDTVEFIQMNRRSSVFRAQLLRPDQPPVRVVLKIDPTGLREKDFLNEALAYETGAKALQGDIVPLFYGTFQTDVENVVVTCAIVQDCGERMDCALHAADKPGFLSELVDAVDRLHLHGVSHGDLYERNILSHDGRPILIDIEKMQTHSCGRRMIVLQGAIAPTVEEFGCPELHDFIMRCGLWSSNYVSFATHPILKSHIDSLDYLLKFMPGYCLDALEWRKRLKAQACVIYENLKKERIITYGTDNLSECNLRLDVF